MPPRLRSRPPTTRAAILRNRRAMTHAEQRAVGRPTRRASCSSQPSSSLPGVASESDVHTPPHPMPQVVVDPPVCLPQACEEGPYPFFASTARVLTLLSSQSDHFLLDNFVIEF